MTVNKIINLVEILAWPLVAIVFLIAFYKPVSNFIKRLAETLTVKSVKLSVFEQEITLDVGEARETLEELKMIIGKSTRLDDKEKTLFDKIEVTKGKLKVSELCYELYDEEEFVRNKSEIHDHLRNLRENMLIRPNERGSWKADRYPILTSFGQLVHDLERKKLSKNIKNNSE